MADAAQVAKVLRNTIAQKYEFINASLAEVSNLTLNMLVDYWIPAPAGTMYPLIMIQHIDEDYAWKAMPNIYTELYQFDIYGFIRNEEPETAARAIEKMAGAVKKILMQSNMSIVLDDGTPITYVDARGSGWTPAMSTRYIEAVAGDGVLSRGFRMRWKGAVHLGAPDSSSYVNYLVNTGQEPYNQQV